jgi:tRNA 2-selenouridine synthase
MRSAGIAWLLDLYGYNILTLKGGYKIFRNWVLSQFTKEWKIRCLGGYTGSGKTEILESLRKHGCQVIDLEFLAKHKGSAFGGIGQVEKQPSQEMFENELALSLHAFESKNESLSSSKTIWLEDESQRIGAVNIPQPLWEQMKVRELLFVDIPFKSRLSFIVDGYGKLDRGLLMAAISRLQKKLGGLETKNAISFMIDDNIEKCFQILLVYYDKLYSKAFQRKQETLEKFAIISFDAVSPDVISKIILERYGNE